MAKVLLIEDNKVQARAGIRDLEGAGYDVQWAEDGKSAIKASASGVFDIILLDIILPDMHGNQICQWLKQNEATRLTPIIMLTSQDSINDRVTGLEAGADDYIQKPYDIHELDARIRACLRTKALQDELSAKNKELEKLLNEVERLAITDHLTGLYNRRHFNSMLQREYNATERYTRPLACFIIDIDHFKSINDTYGHQAGDLVLKGVAKTLEGTLRKVDMLARWGGEEFVVLLPQTGLKAAKLAARRILDAVSSTQYPDIEDRKVTVSLGLCCLPHPAIKTAEGLISAVDQAMYIAKENGRNRFEVFGHNGDDVP